MSDTMVPPALRSNGRVRVLFDNEYAASGRPTMIMMRPIRQAGSSVTDLNIFRSLQTQMVREIIRVVRQYTGWSSRQTRLLTSGALMMDNITNDGSTFSDNVELTRFDVNQEDLFLDTFERASGAGSNPDLNVYNVEWRFFIRQASITVGGAPLFKNIDSLKGINNWDKKLKNTNEIKHEDIDCGTRALAYGMELVLKEFSTKKTSLFNNISFTNRCSELKKELGFESMVSVSNLGIFVDHYPEWRLVVIYSIFHTPTLFKGKDYIFTANRKVDKTVYIYHDASSNHYITVTAPDYLCQSFKYNSYVI